MRINTTYNGRYTFIPPMPILSLNPQLSRATVNDITVLREFLLGIHFLSRSVAGACMLSAMAFPSPRR